MRFMIAWGTAPGATVLGAAHLVEIGPIVLVALLVGTMLYGLLQPKRRGAGKRRRPPGPGTRSRGD